MDNEKKKTPGISRRDFLKDAGLIAGGAALGTSGLLAGCAGKADTKASITVYDINGAHEIIALLVQRLGDLNGKTIAGLAADPTKWQTMRTFPYIFDQIKLKYPGVTIIPHTTFTMGTGINDDGVAQSVKNRKADACIVGNAG